jgi:predicted RNase H-like HicB family nuclease
MKVRDVIKVLKRWLAASPYERQPSAVSSPLEAGDGNRGRTSVTGHSTRNIEQYPQIGWFEMKYLVIYEKSESGWGAYAPDLPGLGVAAKTQDEAKELMREAIEFHLEGMRHHGDAIPAPSATTEYITV